MSSKGGYALVEIKERFKTNLSSKQYIVILNKMINLTCKPLFTRVPYMRELVLQAVLQTQDDHRRRISIHKKDEMLRLVTNAVAQNDYSFIEECELNRSIPFLAAGRTLDIMQPACDYEMAILMKKGKTEALRKLKGIEKVLGIPYDEIAPLYRWSKYNYDNYHSFRTMVIEKYARYAYNEAVAGMSVTGLQISLPDLYMNYLGAVSRAVDKCDAGKGTLTSYIQQWMLSARSNPEFDHQVGVAYDIPSPMRKEIEDRGGKLTNMSQTLNLDKDTEDVEYRHHLDNMFESNPELLMSLRGLKDSKLLFMVMGIIPPLTEEERAKLILKSNPEPSELASSKNRR